MRTYTEAELAAEEDKLGSRLPDALRRRYLDGIPDTVVLLVDGDPIDSFEVWGPSTTDTDTKGREYPTPGMVAETQEIRDVDEGFLDEDVVVGWGANAGGDLAVVGRDGSLAWWRMHGGEIEPVEVEWDRDEIARLVDEIG